MKKLLLLGFGLIFLAFCGNAQSRPPQSFKYIKPCDNKNSRYTKIEFRDSVQNSVIKTLVLHDINPYFFPGEEVIDSTEEDTPVYKIPSTKTTLKGVSLLSKKYPGKYDPKTGFKVWSNYWISDNSQDFVVILIVLNCRQTSHQIIRKTSLYVYNRKGELVRKMEHIDNDLHAPMIMSDGRYVTCGQGGEGGVIEGDYSNVPAGFLIIDLEQQKIVYTKEVDSASCGQLYGKYFFAWGDRRTMETFDLIIIDLEKGYDYIKEVSYALNPVSIADDKILLKNQVGETVVMYLKDFKSQKINTHE